MKRAIIALTLALNSPSFGQVAVDPGDLIIFDIYDSYSLVHIDRDTQVRTKISGRRYDPNWVLLFQNTREIQQHTDGNFYIGNTPYDHILKVDARYGRSESKNLLALYPEDVFGYSLNKDCHAINDDGICFRIGYKRNEFGIWIGGVIAHRISDGSSWLVSEGNLLSSDIAAIDLLEDGTVVVVQDDETPNVILVDPKTGAQSLIGSSLLFGRVTDLEVLSDGRLAVAAANSGLVIVDYEPAEAPLTGYVANFTSYDPPGGFTYRVKEDIDGNPIVGSVDSANRYFGDKLNLDTGLFERIYNDVGIAFEVAKHPVVLNERIELSMDSNGAVRIEFFGELMESEDLISWDLVDPQPESPYTLYPSPQRPSAFFKLSEAN